MKLRGLREDDAFFMLEWMHDKNVVSDLQTNFMDKTINDCLEFIVNSQKESDSINWAIVDDNDEYMGTVSLKHINKEEMNAEFAISMRSCAMGRGFSISAMKKVLRYGKNALKLKQIYWCVSPANKRAIRFYDKNGFIRMNNLNETVFKYYSVGQVNSYIWYQWEC